LPKRVLVTGGAGFIGANLARRLLGRGEEVVLFDNLSRAGTPRNLEWLNHQPNAARLEFRHADIRDRAALRDAAAGCSTIVHLAGQVAVTRSLADPVADFEANATGALNVLEVARWSAERPLVLYASTNKVYGDLSREALREEETRWVLAKRPFGIDEEQPIALHSPYACSKGCGDLYALDYHRSFGVRTVVVRQSCIYGPRQMGVEDQGWVVWMARQVLRGETVRVYGDGKQVRDLLHIDDLLDVYDAIEGAGERAWGEAYNVGGGPGNTLSIWRELAPWLERRFGVEARAEHHPARSGDQRVFVSDVRKAGRDLGWRPRIGLEEGLNALVGWLRDER
jgi:CDP-paratose 2-epimerase